MLYDPVTRLILVIIFIVCIFIALNTIDGINKIESCEQKGGVMIKVAKGPLTTIDWSCAKIEFIK